MLLELFSEKRGNKTKAVAMEKEKKKIIDTNFYSGKRTQKQNWWQWYLWQLGCKKNDLKAI